MATRKFYTGHKWDKLKQPTRHFCQSQPKEALFDHKDGSGHSRVTAQKSDRTAGTKSIGGQEQTDDLEDKKRDLVHLQSLLHLSFNVNLGNTKSGCGRKSGDSQSEGQTVSFVVF